MIFFRNIALQLFVLFPVISTVNIYAQKTEPVQAIQVMTQRASEVKTTIYNAIMHERIGTKFVDKTSFFKINVSPFKIYVKESFIGIHIEGLYSEGYNENKILISTVGFPWVRTLLDPYGKKVRNNHHHTIYETGFEYFVSVINELLTNHRDDIKLSFDGEEAKHNRNCYKITITDDNFKYINYIVQPGETLTSIAKRLFINDYMILELNPGIDYYNDVKPGQEIQIPTVYAKRMVLYLDKILMLPIQIDIFDDKGLYAGYSYINLIVNPTFAWNEFNTTFKDYHFR
jgi:hypothetical protein